MITLIIIFLILLILACVGCLVYAFWKAFLILGILLIIDIVVFKLLFGNKKGDSK